MKIVHSIYDSIGNPWLGGGGAQRTHEIYKRISEEHAVLIITGNYPNAEEVKDGVCYKRVGFGSNYALSRLTFFLLAPIVLITIKADIYIEDIGFPMPLLISAFKRKGFASVQFIPNKAYSRKRGVIGAFVRCAFRVGIKVYSHVITVSDFAKKEIENINSRAVVYVVPNGVKIPSQKISKGKYILFLGRIDIYQKGIDIFLSALKVLVDQGEALSVVFAGGGEDAEVKKMYSLINKYGIQDVVDYRGPVEGSEKEKIIEESLFLVLPSRSETFGMVALEAFAYGKPIVASSVGGLGEIMRESSAGLIVDSHDAKELAIKIKELLHDLEKREILGARGRSFAEKYDWYKITEDFKKVLEVR